MSALEAVLLTIITASTPLLLAAVGELVTERSGVLNLGVEGMMIMGAVTGFAAAYTTGSAALGVAAAVGAGIAMALLFAFLTQTLAANQMATGLALTLFGIGLSGLVGQPFTGLPGVKLGAIHVPGLSGLPLVGPVLFGQDVLVYASVAITVCVAWMFARTRLGLVIRAVGSNHHSAHALGYNVAAVRYGCIAFGGACAGLAGGYLSLGVHAAVDREHERGTGLDRAGAGGVRHLDARPGGRGRLPVRRRVDHGALRPGRRGDHSAPVPGGPAVPGDHRRAAGHLGQSNLDESQHTCLYRSNVRAGPVDRGRRHSPTRRRKK